MSEQPEPDSGYAVGPDGVPYAKGFDGWWRGVDGRARFADLGEATPLLPAVRPDGVPDDAVPFVGWVGHEDDTLIEWSPAGKRLRYASAAGMAEMGLPVPAAPAPSLPERLRAEVSYLCESDRAGAPAIELRVRDLLIEAADALEAGSQP